MKLMQKLKGALKHVGRPFDVRDLVFAAGTGLLGYGLWQVYQPAAFIVPGALLVIVSMWRSG